MNSRTRKISKGRWGAALAGATALAATLGTANEAHAYVKSQNGGESWFYGNDHFMSGVSPLGASTASGYISDGLPYHLTREFTTFAVYAKVLGVEGWPIWTEAVGQAETRAGKYATVGGRVKMMGKTLWTPDPEGQVGCEPSPDVDTACASYDKDLSATFFRVPIAKFMISFVPVNVYGSVGGGIYGHLGVRTTAMQGLPAKRGHHLGIVSVTGSSGAYASASLDAFAGIEGVLAVGVTTSFRVIDVSGVLSNRVTHRNDDVVKTFISKYDLGFNIKSMSGKVDVWAQITPLFKPTQTLINIGGFNQYKPIYQGTKSQTVPAVTL